MKPSSGPPDTAQMAKPGDQAWRGDRLHPARLNARFYTLHRLREELEASIAAVDRESEMRVLDFGCGSMPYRPLFSGLRAAVSYRGADLPGNSLADIRIQPDGTLGIGDEHFDIVISTQVLEHVVDPALYLSECYRVLRPGGHLIISTHGHWMYHPDPGDFWRWTGDGLRRIIEVAGFQVSATRAIGNLAAAALQLFQDAIARHLGRGAARVLFAAIMQRLASLACRITGGDSVDEAIIYVVTAQRPAAADG